MIRFGKPSSYLVAGIPFSSELYHHGIKGQKWGVRRFQNLDRTLTPAGKLRYSKGDPLEPDFSAKHWKKSTKSYNDHEYAAFEYQDDPNTKKLIDRCITTTNDGRILNDFAKRYYEKDKEYIDKWVKYSWEAAKKRGTKPEYMDEGELEEIVKKDYPDYTKTEKEHASARTMLKTSITSAVTRGAFDEVFDGHPPLSFVEKDSKYHYANVIDGRKSVLAMYIADKYSQPGYGNDYITPEEFMETRTYYDGKIGKKR